MTHLEQARPEQLQALAAFAGRAFRTRQGPEDFAALLPKLYAPGAGSAPMHTVLYRDCTACRCRNFMRRVSRCGWAAWAPSAWTAAAAGTDTLPC